MPSAATWALKSRCIRAPARRRLKTSSPSAVTTASCTSCHQTARWPTTCSSLSNFPRSRCAWAKFWCARALSRVRNSTRACASSVLRAKALPARPPQRLQRHRWGKFWSSARWCSPKLSKRPRHGKSRCKTSAAAKRASSVCRRTSSTS